jgi:hypothetical protein
MTDQNYIQTQPDRMSRISKYPREESRQEQANGTAAAAKTVPADRPIGQRYLLRARLARGRLGDIYEAVDAPGGVPGIQRHVAIQLLDEQVVARPHFADEFERGAAEIQAISHPNILKWLDFGRDGNRYFLVMEFLDSASLRFVLDDVMALPVEETAAIVRAVGDALQYLHAKAMVHGNLKPENVLVTFDYKVKLQDVVPLSWLSAAPGTAGKAESDARTAPDIRDDVYALACLAYELLAGRHPFNANTPSEALRAGLEPMPIDGLSPRQWQALAGGLALQREHRTPTVTAFFDEFGITGIERLRTIVGVVATSHRAPAPPAPRPAVAMTVERFMPPRRRSTGTAGKLLLLLVVAGLAALTFAYYDRLRDWTAETMVSTDAKVRDVFVARLGGTTAAPVAARSSDATAPTGNAVVPAPVPAVDQESAVAPPSLASGAGEPVAPEPQFRFARTVMTISESEVAARIVIQRSGDATRPASVVWWTSENTAIAGEDYADLGRRVEMFAPGEQSRAVYVPLVNDTVAESTKSFNVYLGHEKPGRNHIDLLASTRVDIFDDD